LVFGIEWSFQWCHHQLITKRVFFQFIVKALVAIITQQDVAEPTQCIATADGPRTWIQCCVQLSLLMGISEQWCWSKYVYLLYAAGMNDKGDQVSGSIDIN